MPITRFLRFLPLLAALTLSTACRPHPKPTTRLAPPTATPTTRPATQPIIDIRRGTFSFPLATTQPIDSAASLTDSLRAGFLALLTPASPDFLTLTGPLPTLDLLRIDISNATVRPNYRPAHFDKVTTTERTFTIHRLEYLANGLSYSGTSARISLTADNARLDLIHDAKNVRGLAIAGARLGTFDFYAPAANLNRMITFAADGANGPLTVLRTAITFTSDDPHSLATSLDVRARWLLLPMTFTLHGRLTAAPDGTVTFSDLDVTGYDPGGLLAAAFLNPQLHKMDGHSQPLLSFPDAQTHVTDARFSTIDGLRLTIEFAGSGDERP